jgi:hypothetical protein
VVHEAGAFDHLDEQPAVEMVAAGVKRQLSYNNCRARQAAGVANEVAAKLGGEVLPEGVEGGRNPAMSRAASRDVLGEQGTLARRGSDFLKIRAYLSLAG